MDRGTGSSPVRWRAWMSRCAAEHSKELPPAAKRTRTAGAALAWRRANARVMIQGPRRRHAPHRPHRPEAQDVALSRPKHGFESRWGRQTFLGLFTSFKVLEKGCGYGGSIKSISVERDPFRR